MIDHSLIVSCYMKPQLTATNVGAETIATLGPWRSIVGR